MFFIINIVDFNYIPYKWYQSEIIKVRINSLFYFQFSIYHN
jgi:hypothetical protein